MRLCVTLLTGTALTPNTPRSTGRAGHARGVCKVQGKGQSSSGGSTPQKNHHTPEGAIGAPLDVARLKAPMKAGARTGFQRTRRQSYDPRVRKAPAKKYCPRKPSASAWVLPLAGLAPTPRAPRRARSPAAPRPAAVSRFRDRATPAHHRARRRPRRALRTPHAVGRPTTIRRCPTRRRSQYRRPPESEPRRYAPRRRLRMLLLRRASEATRANKMAAGRASCPPAIPPGRRSLRGEASQHRRRRRRQQQPSAVARSSARRPPLPPSPLRAHALTAVAAVAVAAVAVAAVATAAARLLRRCSTGRRLLAAATPAAPLSITRRSSPEARVEV